MEPALKQRLIGGAVLVALAVIFLPMLIKGPAPESGAADVPLDMPAEPRDGMRTMEIPLGEPAPAAPRPAPADPDALPTVDTTTAAPAAPTPEPTAPSDAAGGDWAVSFASYATPADADKVIAALRGVQLRAWQEAVTGRSGRTVHRVRIGPFASEAEAEAARLRAARVRGDIKAQVIALDGGAVPLADPRTATASVPATASAPVPLASPPKTTVATLPPAPKPATPAIPAPTAVAATPKPTATPPAPAAPAEPRAAAGTGFAVQVGAFSKPEDATALRDRLRGAGFSAFIEDVRTDKGTLKRVRVGPVATREQATALRTQVTGKVGVSGDVRPHP